MVSCDKCRRSIMALHFSESLSAKECNYGCDVCLLKKKEVNLTTTIDITKVSTMMCKVIQYNQKKKISPLQLVKIIHGSCKKKVFTNMLYTLGLTPVKDLKKLYLEEALNYLICQNYIDFL